MVQKRLEDRERPITDAPLMPVRKRKSRRKPSASLDEWHDVFVGGAEIFIGELRDAGVETDEHGRPDMEEARAAWHRLGPEFLAGFTDSHTPWALTEFGEP